MLQPEKVFLGSDLALRAIERRRVARLGSLDEPHSEEARIAQALLRQSIDHRRMVQQNLLEPPRRRTNRERAADLVAQRQRERTAEVRRLLKQARRIEAAANELFQENNPLHAAFKAEAVRLKSIALEISSNRTRRMEENQ